jgi:hypothetical protein
MQAERIGTIMCLIFSLLRIKKSFKSSESWFKNKKAQPSNRTAGPYTNAL